MSLLRRRVFLKLAIEDVPRFLPWLAACELQGLNISLSSGVGGEDRLAMTVHYKSSVSAHRSSNCLLSNLADREQQEQLVRWVLQARGQPESYTRKLHIRVTRDDAERLIDGLAWAIRTAKRKGKQ